MEQDTSKAHTVITWGPGDMNLEFGAYRSDC